MTLETSRHDAWLARASALITAAAVLYLVGTVGDPLRMNWGDPWSDCNIQLSGRVFARDGFLKNSFDPTIDLDPLPAHPLRYTHNPPLPDIVNGLEQTILGPRDITVYRIFALALTFSALAFLYLYVGLTWSKK
jgi:hypothetical protein